MFRRKQKPEEPAVEAQPLDAEELKKREDFERRKKRARVSAEVFEAREAQQEEAAQKLELATQIMHSLLGPDADGAALERIHGTPPLFLEGLSDIHLKVSAQFSVKDKVVNRWSVHGEHTRELLGIPPTSQEIQVGGVTVLELKGDSGRLTYTIGYDDTEQVLMVQAASGREISPDDSNKALFTCNRWNEQNWLPKVYTEAAGGDSETEYKRFRAEMTLPLGSAVSQALVDEFTRTAVESCRRFWDWLVQEEPSLELV